MAQAAQATVDAYLEALPDDVRERVLTVLVERRRAG
jgi:hypothetical protein